jgi:branched-chain amino acid transport system permease protein
VSEQMFFQVLVNAIGLSLIYILIAMGLTLVFSIMRMINFAHSELYMLGGFSVYFLFGQWGIYYWLAVFVGALLVAVVGVFLEWAIFRPLRHDLLAACLASLGIGIMLQTGALLAFGERDKDVATVYKGIIEVSGVYFPLERLIIVVASALLALALIIFINKFRLGQALQAVAQNPDAAALVGINVNRMNGFGFAVASGLAAAAGGIISPLVYVTPYMGATPLLKAFIVVIMGGLGSIPGAVLAGFVLGFIEQFSLTLLGYVGNIFGFLIVMVLLVFRPRGFLGREFRVH